MKSMRRYAALGVAAGAIAGGGIGIGLTASGVTSAAADPVPVHRAPIDGETDTQGRTPPTPEEIEARRAERRAAAAERLRDSLAPLVEDGTLSAEQVDKVVERLEAAAAERAAAQQELGQFRMGPGHRGRH